MTHRQVCFTAVINDPANVGSSTSSIDHSSTTIPIPHIHSSHNGPAPVIKSKPATTD